MSPDVVTRWLVWSTTLYPSSSVAVTRWAFGPLRGKRVRPMRQGEATS